MDQFMRSTFSPAWAYYLAFGILLVWWIGHKLHNKR